jgi:hypothetical protein
MLYNSKLDQTNKLANTSVTDILQQETKSLNGEQLFTCAYPPQFGIRECITPLKNYSEAISYIEVAHGELAQMMDDEAIERVFEKPTQAKLAMGTTKWTPNNKVLGIFPTYTPTTQGRSTKCNRQDKGNIVIIRNYTQSYSAVAASTTCTSGTIFKQNDLENYKKEIKEEVIQQLHLLQKSIVDNKISSDAQYKDLHQTIQQ